MIMILRELVNGISRTRTTDERFSGHYDVIVAGLGTAGALAAIAAGEQGASVLGVERSNMCGGTATAGGVFGYYYGLKGGRFEEVDARAAELQKQCFIPGGCFHPDTKSMELDRQIRTAGGKISYESAIIGVYVDNNGKIGGVRVAAPEGIVSHSCDVLIDASGDGEVCAMAGAGFTHGRTIDGQSQPFSSIRVTLTPEGKIGLANFDAGYVAVTDGRDMSRGIIQANSLHSDSPDPMLWITTIPGPREGRLIECDTTLKFSDFLSGKVTGEPVALCYSNFDSHSQDWALEDENAKDWMVAASLWGKCFVFPVPLQSMTVKGFDNLMAVGRCLSVDHLMASAIRMQRGMQKLGEAAGISAALAAKNRCAIRNVKYQDIISRLAHGLVMDGEVLPDCSWPDDSQLQTLLAGDKPGEAIWKCSRNVQPYLSMLHEALQSNDRVLSGNAAITLALAGHAEALPVLRQLLDERDSFIPASSRRHNQPRLLAVIHLLGKFPVHANLEALVRFAGIKGLKFQEISHCMTALFAIGEKLPSARNEVAAAFNTLLDNSSPDSCRLLLKNSSFTGADFFEPMHQLLRLIAALKLKAWNIDNTIADGLDSSSLSWREQQLLKQLRSA